LLCVALYDVIENLAVTSHSHLVSPSETRLKPAFYLTLPSHVQHPPRLMREIAPTQRAEDPTSTYYARYSLMCLVSHPNYSPTAHIKMGSDSVYYARMASIPIIFILVGFAASLPWLLARLGHAKTLMVYFVCFSAGAMFGIGLLHMIPESRELWESYLNHGGDDVHAGHDPERLRHGDEDELYPYAELLSGCTVILLVGVEHFLARYLARKSEKQAAGGEAGASHSHGHGHSHGGGDHHGHSHAMGAFDDDDEESSHTHEDSELHSTKTGPSTSIDIGGTPRIGTPKGTPKFLVGTPKNGGPGRIVLGTPNGQPLPPVARLPSAAMARSLIQSQIEGSPAPSLRGILIPTREKSVNGLLPPNSQDSEVDIIPIGTPVRPGTPGSPLSTGSDVGYTSLPVANLITAAPGTPGSSRRVNRSDFNIASADQAGALEEPEPIVEPLAITDDLPEGVTERVFVGDDGEMEWYYYYYEEDVAEPVATEQVAKQIDEQRRKIDAYISALAICVHCIFNGLALGSEKSNSTKFWTLFGATIGHKVMDGFAVGVPIYRARLSKLTTIIVLGMVAFATPLGVIIGYWSTAESGILTRAIVMSLSTGSFFFVSLFELIPVGLKSPKWLEFKMFCVALGFASMAIVAKWA